MSEMTPFKPPRLARIRSSEYARYSDIFARMGLESQEFRVIGENQGQVLVHPEDHLPREKDVTVRKGAVEFIDES